MNMKRIVWMVGLLIWSAGLQPGWSFFNPSTGKWLSRDPIAERGGLNVYSMVANNLVDSIDVLGMGALKPSCMLESVQFLPLGWAINNPGFGSGVTYVFSVRVKWDCCSGACCEVGQLVRTTASINGVPVTTDSEHGSPLDGAIHVDPLTNIAKPEEKCMFVYGDAPGFYNLSRNSTLSLTMSIWISVRDACNGRKLLWRKSFDLSISGTYPDGLTLNPNTIFRP